MPDSKSSGPPDEPLPLTPSPDDGETLAGEPTPPGKPSASTSGFSKTQILAGRFRILRFVARGGMGEVYEAEDLELNERVALKTVRFEMAEDERAVERFKREIQLARKVTHASVCRTFDVFRHADGNGENAGRDTLVVSMEFLRGTTLARQITLDGRLKPAFALPIVEQMAAGLEAAHAAGVIHRDFKCANVILVPSPASPGGFRAVITDFGLAHAVTGNMASLTGSLDVVGTPAYMAPEQLEGKEITPATDTYALGVVMYEMLTGQVPFQGSTVISTALKRLTEPAPSPRTIVEDIDPRWEAVILRCLERDPAKRFATTLDVAEALRGREVSQPIVVPDAVRPKKYLAAGIIAALAVLSVVIYFANARRETNIANPVPGPATSATAIRKSVAILGFQNMSGRPELALLSDELTDGLWSQLDVEQIRFIPPGRVDDMRRDLGIKEVKQDPGKEQLQRIARYLGADVIVTGSYRVSPGKQGEKGGENIEWNVHMLRAADNESIGSIPDKGSTSDVNELAARVGKRIRNGLGISLSFQEEARLYRSFSTNPQALQSFAAAREKLRQFDLQSAIKLLAKSVESDPQFAQPHVELAGAWSELGFETRAQEEAKKALALSANMSVEGKGLVTGRVYETQHDWPKAIEQYASLWTLYKDNPEYGLLLARSQTSAGKAAQALTTLSEVRKLKLASQLAAQADLQEAEAQEGVSNFAAQLTAATAAAEKAKALDARLLLARARVMQCGALLNAGKANEAKPNCEEARQINDQQGDALGTARATNGVANAIWMQGDNAAAKALYEQALGKAQAIGDRRDEAGALNNLANILDSQGDAAGAERNYRQSITVARERGSQGDLALAQQNLAVFLYSAGKRKESAAAFQQAIEIAQKIGDRKTEARALNNRCGLLLSGGEVAAAKQSCDQSLRLRRDLGDQNDLARSLGSAGDVQLAQGDLGAAEQNYREALQIEERLGQKQDAAATRLSLADWARESGKLDDARKYATDAAAEFASEKDAASEANAQLTLAEIALKTGNESEARASIEKARHLAESSGDANLKLRIAIAQAKVETQWGNASAAITALQNAAKDTLKSGEVALALDARIALSEAQNKAGKPTEARATEASAAREAKSKGLLLLAQKAEAASRNFHN
jgi:tetratricopeptide (TPR) repeat protein/tRNA A-37 threonylcarbamoyl transferase component Bud32